MQVHSQLMLVDRDGQSQLILVENRADCRLACFRLQVITAMVRSNKYGALTQLLPASAAFCSFAPTGPRSARSSSLMVFSLN